PFSMTTETSSGTTKRNSPFWPLILTDWPSTAAVTPLGTAIGFLPTRDMMLSLSKRSEDGAQHLAAHMALARLMVGHDTERRRQDRHAEPVRHARHRIHRRIDAPSRLRHACDFANDGLAIVVFELDLEFRTPIAELGRVVAADIAFRLQHVEHARAKL